MFKFLILSQMGIGDWGLGNAVEGFEELVAEVDGVALLLEIDIS